MVFVGGPRQVGKTTMAKLFINDFESHGGTTAYLNWDITEHRDAILKNRLPDVDLWCFDELHKYHQWRDFLKGLYDAHKDEKKILVTGSAHLDYYRYSGDSLQGRYHYLRLNPLSWHEIEQYKRQEESGGNSFEALLTLGGFPEPFLNADLTEAKRWRLEYRKRILEEEVRTLEQVKSLSAIELLASRLPELVGSPLSINALREDLQVSHKSVSLWLDILERLFHIFRIRPYGSPAIRAIKKECKHYHYDWALITDEGARFENFIATHLLKWVQYQEDCFGEPYELRYARDRDGREVDFLILLNGEVEWMIEVKISKPKSTPTAIKYMKARIPTKHALVVCLEEIDPVIDQHGIQYRSAKNFLKDWI